MEQANNKTFYLQGLNCASCAQKIEDKISKLPNIKKATINLVSQKLLIEATSNNFLPSASEIAKLADAIEPGVKVTDTLKTASSDHVHDHGSRTFLGNTFIVIGAIIFAFATYSMFYDVSPIDNKILFVISYILIGGQVVWRAIKNITKGQFFDENFLMTTATIGAFAIGEYPEAAAVMLFYQIGEFFQDLAVERARNSISDLMDIRPDFANLKVGNEIKLVSPEEIKTNDYIIIKPGEKVPLDGIVVDGISSLDTSALTGESLPRDVEKGDTILSGFINKNGLLTIQVTKEFGESTIAKILDLVENASNNKASTETFITKFARYYTPIVVFLAVLLAVLPPLILADTDFSTWIHRALIFLVISCPCALVISIPLSFFAGIGGASKKGILVKGSNYLEALNNVESVVFDKTGTLTKGNFKVTNIAPVDNITSEELLYYAAHAENFSNHPIAISIQNAFKEKINQDNITDYQEIAGHGISVKINGKNILAGNSKLLDSNNIPYKQATDIGTIVYLAIECIFAGYITIADELKADSKTAISELKKVGVKTIAMLTGDTKEVAEKIAKDIGLDKVYSELLPHQKIEQLEKIEQKKTTDGNIIFVGDGINDAPVLARADIGIAMGGIGSDAAIEASDIVIMTDEPSKIVTAIKIAKKTKTIVWQNIILALGVKAVVLILGAFGIATMWEAIFSDVGVALMAILNATRALRTV